MASFPSSSPARASFHAPVQTDITTSARPCCARSQSRISFDDAPQPHVVVVGAQRGRSEKMLEWLRAQTKRADVVMSVCTGAFKLGLAGILDGKTATTHHDFYDRFAEQFPKAKLVKSTRFVHAGGNVYTAGGLTSGIDLALYIVEQYYGRNIAAKTAYYMEYESDGWKRTTVASR